MTNTALVFGASGFIGRWVVQVLEQRGVSVTAVVRDAGASADVFERWRVAPSMVTADLAGDGTAGAFVTRLRPAMVFNLAGYGVDRGERDVALSVQLNTHLPRDLAVACAPTSDWPGAAFVHVGSALEYGTEPGVLDERGPASPTTDYGRSKLAGTLAVQEVARLQRTRAVTARLFTVFGDGEHEGRLFPSLLAAAWSGAALDLTDGRQRRDFAWVSNVASALVDLALAPFTPGEVVNVASGRLHSVEEFIRAVAAEAHVSSTQLRFGTLPTRPEEMAHEGVAVQRMTELLGASLPGDLQPMVAAAVRDERLRRAGLRQAARASLARGGTRRHPINIQPSASP
jgi:nucleoside-diphosphate-sugar epimerase